MEPASKKPMPDRGQTGDSILPALRKRSEVSWMMAKMGLPPESQGATVAAPRGRRLRFPRRAAFWLAFGVGLMPAVLVWVLMTQGDEARWRRALDSAAEERAMCLRHEMRVEAQVLLSAVQAVRITVLRGSLRAWGPIPLPGVDPAPDARWIPIEAAQALSRWQSGTLPSLSAGAAAVGSPSSQPPGVAWQSCDSAQEALRAAMDRLGSDPGPNAIQLTPSFVCGTEGHLAGPTVALVTGVILPDSPAPGYSRANLPGAGGVRPDGYVALFLHVPAVYERAVSYLRPFGLDVRLEEHTPQAPCLQEPCLATPPTLLHWHRSRAEASSPVVSCPANPLLQHRSRISLYGAEWSIVSEASPSLVVARHTWQPWGTAGLLAIIAFVAAHFFQMSEQRAARIAREVEARTVDLSAANRCLRQEVSRREMVEEQLAAARDRALADLRKKSEFVANVSHEIRTPLNGILGMVELLGLSKLDEEQARYADSAISSGRLLRGLLADILDFSRLESNRVEIHPTEFSPSKLSQDVVQLLARDVARRGISLDLAISSSTPGILIGDPLRISQVMINLASNAVKFTERGFVKLSLATEADGAACRLFLTVEDSGMGIPRQQLGEIFEPFHQVNDCPSSRYGGVGLGLTITRRLVLAMQGTIDVESEPGKGTCFRVSLLLELPPGQEESAQSLRLLSRNTASSGPGSPKPAPGAETHAALPPRAIVADDNPVNRFLLDRQLQKMGFHVLTCETGSEAFELWMAERPEYLFADLNMPGLDGLALARAVRAQEQRGASQSSSPTTLVLVTAAHSPTQRREASEAGFDTLLGKPFGLAELQGVVVAVGRRRETATRLAASLDG